MKKYIFSVKALIAVFLGWAILLIACGGTRDDSLFLEEEKFPTEQGVESATNPAAGDSEQQADEAEVLRLLGISKEEQAKPTEAAPATSGTSSLENEVTSLTNQIAEKDRELESLRTELNARDTRITNLEQELRRSKSPGSRPKTAGQAGATSDYEQAYQQALSRYYDKDYNGAIGEFERLLSIDSNNSLSDNCQYWIGECYYGLGNYQEAVIEFEKVFNFADSNKADDAQLKLGLCYMQLGDNAKARSEFERLLTNYPDSEYVGKADQYLSSL